MAETVWAESRARFMVLFGMSSSRNRGWGLLGGDSPESDQRELPGLLWTRNWNKMGKKLF